MHKYPEFSESVYMSFFSDEGKSALHEIVNKENLLKDDYAGWKADFSIDPDTVIHDSEGNANVRSYMREMNGGFLSDMRAPLGDSLPAKEFGEKFYFAPIAHFSTKHFHDTTATLKEKEQIWKNFASNYSAADEKFIMSYLEKVQTLKNSVDMTITNMGEQLMTNGYLFYNQGSGIKDGIYKAEIPAENFINAGSVVWSDPTAPLIDYLRSLVETLNTKHNVKFSWQLDIPQDMWFNYFLKNKQVIEYTQAYQASIGIVMPTTNYVSEDKVVAMLQNTTGLPTIFVHNSKQVDEVNGVVSGWKKDIATLRPLGRAGLIRHTNPLDAEYFDNKMTNPSISSVFTSVLNGLGYLENTIYPDGRMLQYRTRIIYSVIPTLDEFLYHYIISTNKTE